MSNYGEDYFETLYAGGGYTPQTVYLYLKPFVTSVNNLISFSWRFKPPIRILDVGCAKGYLVRMLRGDGIDAYGVDFSPYAIRSAPDEIKPYIFKVDIEHEVLPFQDGSLDLVVSFSTFEHLSLIRFPFILSETLRVLRPDGLLVINVPNSLNKTETKKPGHITVLSKKTWIKLLEKLGFHYESLSSRQFDVFRTREIAAIRLHSFHLMGLRVSFPDEMKTLVTSLMILRRKLLAPNFTLIFCKA